MAAAGSCKGLKSQVVEEFLAGERTQAQLARQYGVVEKHPNYTFEQTLKSNCQGSGRFPRSVVGYMSPPFFPDVVSRYSFSYSTFAPRFVRVSIA